VACSPMRVWIMVEVSAAENGQLCPGRPRIYDDEQVVALMRKVLHSRPANSTQWKRGHRGTGHRHFQEHGGALLRGGAVPKVVVSHALDVSEAIGNGWVERLDSLFAALNVLDGGVITQCKPRHRHQEFLAFLNHLDHNVSADLEVHLIANNYATNEHPRLKAWLARHPRFQIHYTATNAWLAQTG
jgi:hypothetical protein